MPMCIYCVYNSIYSYNSTRANGADQLFIALSNSNPAPLYEQIQKQIVDQITTSRLLPGTPLPSIRALAKELEISVITVKKAYEDLEAAGYIITQQGKGSFVAEASQEFVKETRLRAIERSFEQGISEGKGLGLSSKEIRAIFDTLLEE